MKCIIPQDSYSTDKNYKILGRLVSEYVREALAGTEIVQEIPSDEEIFALYGDMALLNSEMIDDLRQIHHCEQNAVTGFSLENTEDGGIFLFAADCFSGGISDSLAQLKNSGRKINIMVQPQNTSLLRVNSCRVLAEATQIMRGIINNRLIGQGVFMLDPSQVYADFDVEVGAGTMLYPGTILENGTKIGQNCIIGPNSRLVHATVGSGTQVQYSVALDSSIGDNTEVGPFAYIRPHSDIGKNCKVGDFVEVKNATIGDNTKASHLTYVGDSDFGSGINIGCGTITVNYDGKHKHRTVVEDNVFIGCNSNLIAPVRIAKGAFIAAGSTITDDVPPETLAIARARQVVKTGWRKE